MNTKADTSPGILDAVKLVLAAAVLIGGVVAYYYYEDTSLLLRVVGVLVGFCTWCVNCVSVCARQGVVALHTGLAR